MCLQESFERVAISTAISTANAIINQVCMRMPRKKRKMSIKAGIKIKLRIHIHDAINFIWIVLNINIHNISIANRCKGNVIILSATTTPHSSRITYSSTDTHSHMPSSC